MNLNLTGRLSECVLLAYRAPAEIVQSLVPRGLELVTRGPWAFWNIVACRVQGMRPSGLPSWLGLTYCHVAYRLYVRAPVKDLALSEKSIEGLYFVHSDADNWAVSIPGNLLSDFRFHSAAIDLESSEDAVRLRVEPRNAPDRPSASATSAELHARCCAPALAAGSSFGSWEEASRFLKYRPLGLSVDKRGRRLKLAEVIRDEANWRETALRVTQARWALLERLCPGAFHLEMAIRIAPIDYRWRLGGSLIA